MSNIKRVMIINWHWDEDLEYPSYPDELKEIKEILELSPELNVLEEPKVQFVDNELIYKEQEDSIGTLIPTEVGLSSKMNKDEKREEFLSYFQAKYPDPKTQLLFLFHRGDEIVDISNFLKLRKSLHTDENAFQDRVQFGIFGGGRGTIYQEGKGLLNPGISTFMLDEEFASAWFDPKNDIKALAIKRTHFDHVWNHYWYQIRRKIEKLRSLIHLAQIPKTDEELDTKVKELKTQAQQYAQNLLFHLGYEEYEDSKELKEEWDFSNCDKIALNNWISGKNGELFSKTDEWLKELKKFADSTDQEISNELTSGFDELIMSFY